MRRNHATPLLLGLLGAVAVACGGTEPDPSGRAGTGLGRDPTRGQPGDPSASSDRCGGLEGRTCEADEYCHYAPADICGAADATGECRATPDVCPMVIAPVCGCDGRTYDNACQANAAGTSVASNGRCGANEPEACGGLLGLSCDEGEYCHYTPDAMCGAADATGECRTPPDGCYDVWAPVCGCDGATYGNDCEANAAGTSVASEGRCR